jgi:hypothetical protein
VSLGKLEAWPAQRGGHRGATAARQSPARRSRVEPHDQRVAKPGTMRRIPTSAGNAKSFMTSG